MLTQLCSQKELPYPLISDPKRELITALGAGDGGKTKRSHFIFEKGGKLVEKKLPVSPADRSASLHLFIIIQISFDRISPKLALEFAKNHVQ